MKRMTYNNVLKAGRLIQKKGYGNKESLEMAIKIFDGMSIEWRINQIVDKETWKREAELYKP